MDSGTEAMCVESFIHSHDYSSVLHCWPKRCCPPVPRCVLTSWSTAKRCCCRAQPRPSSASASSARQAASQLAGTEDAQVSDNLPIWRGGKGIWFTFAFYFHFYKFDTGSFFFFKISHPLCRQWRTPGPPAWVWSCTCWRTALQTSSGSTRVTDKAWASCRAWISCPLRSSRR